MAFDAVRTAALGPPGTADTDQAAAIVKRLLAIRARGLPAWYHVVLGHALLRSGDATGALTEVEPYKNGLNGKAVMPLIRAAPADPTSPDAGSPPSTATSKTRFTKLRMPTALSARHATGAPMSFAPICFAGRPTQRSVKRPPSYSPFASFAPTRSTASAR